MAFLDRSQETFIYWVQAVDGGPVKIGYAVRPAHRLMMLQTGNPRELVIRRLQRGAIRDEMWLHDLFGAYRIRGEWFRSHPVLAEMCGAIPDAELADEVFRLPKVWSVIAPAWVDEAPPPRVYGAPVEEPERVLSDVEKVEGLSRLYEPLTVIPRKYAA